jgi:tRNA threonylcarbamoyl adenosine modification protein YeaZ
MDTSTEAVSVGLLDLPADGSARLLARRSRPGARQHGELLMPSVLEVCAEAGVRLPEVAAVVCGVGPGPFTGLRVGLVSAASLGDALGIPVHGVCSLDAVAATVHAGEPLLVVSDARRRELYWAAYDAAGARVVGPAVHAPDAVPGALAAAAPGLDPRWVAGPVAGEFAELLGGAPLRPGEGPDPAGLVAMAAAALRAGVAPEPLEPCYLRRPDAVPPAARKRVSPVASPR